MHDLPCFAFVSMLSSQKKGSREVVFFFLKHSREVVMQFTLEYPECKPLNYLVGPFREMQMK